MAGRWPCIENRTFELDRLNVNQWPRWIFDDGLGFLTLLGSLHGRWWIALMCDCDQQSRELRVLARKRKVLDATTELVDLRFIKCRTDDDFADGLHLRSEYLVDAFELLKIESRNLGNDIVNARLE